jgi:hypothetical protein
MVNRQLGRSARKARCLWNLAGDAFQCGYCTPGQIMSAIGCVKEGHAGDEDTIGEYMSGNLLPLRRLSEHRRRRRPGQSADGECRR